MWKRRTIAWLATATVLFGCVGPAAGEEGAPREEDLAREMLRVSGGSNLGMQVMQQLIESFKAAKPEVPEEFWDQFARELDPSELEDLVVPIYVEHLNAEQMSAAIEFYRTPEGKAILEKMPIIVHESMQVGQTWGMELGRRVAERIETWKDSDPDT